MVRSKILKGSAGSAAAAAADVVVPSTSAQNDRKRKGKARASAEPEGSGSGAAEAAPSANTQSVKKRKGKARASTETGGSTSRRATTSSTASSSGAAATRPRNSVAPRARAPAPRNPPSDEVHLTRRKCRTLGVTPIFSVEDTFRLIGVVDRMNSWDRVEKEEGASMNAPTMNNSHSLPTSTDTPHVSSAQPDATTGSNDMEEELDESQDLPVGNKVDVSAAQSEARVDITSKANDEVEEDESQDLLVVAEEYLHGRVDSGGQSTPASKRPRLSEEAETQPQFAVEEDHYAADYEGGHSDGEGMLQEPPQPGSPVRSPIVPLNARPRTPVVVASPGDELQRISVSPRTAIGLLFG